MKETDAENILITEVNELRCHWDRFHKYTDIKDKVGAGYTFRQITQIRNRLIQVAQDFLQAFDPTANTPKVEFIEEAIEVGDRVVTTKAAGPVMLVIQRDDGTDGSFVKVRYPTPGWPNSITETVFRPEDLRKLTLADMEEMHKALPIFRNEGEQQ